MRFHFVLVLYLFYMYVFILKNIHFYIMADLENPAPTEPMCDIKDGDITEGDPMSNIDKLTLELLINKSQYKKYIQKNDPAKYSENKLYLGKIDRYRNKIGYMFSSLLENPEQQITSDINRDFTFFVKTCIQYFELKEMENGQQDHNGDPTDDDVLFGTIENEVIPPKGSLSTDGANKMQASWSTSTYMPKYTMDSYTKRKKS